MNLLIDSHVFIWLRQEPTLISKAASSQLLLKSNRIFLSTATLWELQIKINLGKLKLGDPLDVAVADELQANNLEVLSIEQDHIYGLSNLPPVHGDPFDRLLISQAIANNMTIVSADRHFSSYPVSIIW